MKKILYFYIYVSSDFNENIAVKIHEYCLRKYINVFDDLNFIAAIDNKFDISKIKLVHKWIQSFVSGREYNLDIIENKPPMEGNVLFQKILPKIVNNSKDLCFISHVKGISDVNMTFRNKWSVLRWIISMYYYCLDNMSDIDEFSNNQTYSMYGMHLTHFKNYPNTKLTTHGTIYCGTFYWLKPDVYHKNTLYNSVYPQEETHRFLSENMPLYVKKESLYGPNKGNIVENTIADLYFLPKERWIAYLKNYENAEKCFEFQNKVLMDTIGELGK